MCQPIPQTFFSLAADEQRALLQATLAMLAHLCDGSGLSPMQRAELFRIAGDAAAVAAYDGHPNCTRLIHGFVDAMAANERDRQFTDEPEYRAGYCLGEYRWHEHTLRAYCSLRHRAGRSSG